MKLLMKRRTSEEDEEDADVELGCEVVSGSAGFDINDEEADPDKLLEEFMLSEEESSIERRTPEAPMSVKGERLTGRTATCTTAISR